MANAAEDAFRIVATSALADERTRVLKHGDTFAVFDHFGDIKPGGLGQEGLYHDGTRYLSCSLLFLHDGRPCFLSSTVRDRNDELAVSMTNPELVLAADHRLPMGSLHLSARKFLWKNCCYQQFRLKNHSQERIEISLTIRFEADFFDIFEVRGMRRTARGETLPGVCSESEVTLPYRGLDAVVRRSRITFDPPPDYLDVNTARFILEIEPQLERSLQMRIACESEQSLPPMRFDTARDELHREVERFRSHACSLHTSNSQVDAWIGRAVSDLHMMTTELPTGPYPYAGVPWFNTAFGRDGIITALFCLWLRPAIARGVLSFLAATQATMLDPESDAEPGKILHECRGGEMAALREIPFGRYYGSIDSTPLFVMLAGAYYDRTGDHDFMETLWPSLEAALEWIDRYGDRDGDGFVEYSRSTEQGLLQQGWKDSHDSVFHADGSPATGPIALCEVQSYVYAARLAGANLAVLMGKAALADRLRDQAVELRHRFDEAFWCDAEHTYALALDGMKRPCRVRTSNAGHCLYGGIASDERALAIGHTLLSPESFSGWGVRTVAASEQRYNPMGYHLGSIWPHDNAIIAHGLARYGRIDDAVRIWRAQFAAGLHFELHRMPELFCGFARESGEGPVLYPVACSPQAWAAASVFQLFQAMLGIEINGHQSTVFIKYPQLPLEIDDLRIRNLEVGHGSIDLHFHRYDADVGLTVTRREGDVQVFVVK